MNQRITAVNKWGLRPQFGLVGLSPGFHPFVTLTRYPNKLTVINMGHNLGVNTLIVRANTERHLNQPLFAILLCSLVGCGPSADSRYDSGYSDGYAEGYNTACQIRATLVW